MARTHSLDALRIFVVAARHLSFTEAASELNLTQSAVSHRIRGLEEELGLALFKRLTRRLELTPHGRTLARKIDHAIAEIDRSISELSRPDDARPLKVTVLPSVASHWLIPRLPRIRCRHPNLDVQVIADPRLLDLRTEGIDLAIRFGRPPYPGYAVTRLMGDRVFPVCAPELLEQHGPIEGIDALLRLPLLHDSATDGDGSDSDWRTWLDHLGRPDAACHAGQHFSEAGMLIDVSHSGDKTTLDAIDISPRAIAITHSNCRALNNHPRLKTDEAIRNLAKKGGVMGITGVRNFVKDREPTTIEDIVDHIDHVVKLVGVEHVGIGSDSDLMGYDHMPKDQYEKLKAFYKASYAFRERIDTDGFDHPRKVYDLTAALIRRKYGDSDIQLILGGNFRRLLAQTWKEPKHTPPPQEKTTGEKKS